MKPVAVRRPSNAARLNPTLSLNRIADATRWSCLAFVATFSQVVGYAQAPSHAAVRSLPIQRWESIDDLGDKLAILETVFWEPLDTTSLRRRIRETRFVAGKRIFELGTGSGLIALCCLKAGAVQVVATDVNPNAIECAAYNARRLALDQHLELRKVEPGDQHAYVALKDDERFDFIVSNPPWEDGEPKRIEDFALYDTRFKLLDSILADAQRHLVPNGEVYLAYGCKTAIRRILDTAKNYDWDAQVLDDRKLDELDEVFLPGMLVRLYRRGSK